MALDNKNGFHSEGLQLLSSMPVDKGVSHVWGNGTDQDNQLSDPISPGTHFVEKFISTHAGQIPIVRTSLSMKDWISTAIVRTGITRNQYRVSPRLYGVGSPDENSEILVTANFKLTFDHLRRELKGINAWILVLDTNGVNVWCAASKGTFGTHELVRRVQVSGIEKVVKHRRLILPQLGATGIRAKDVKKLSGFRVVYGPVRAADIPQFLENNREADQVMRQVTFPFYDRLILTPIELNSAFKPALITAVMLFLISGIGPEFFSFKVAGERGMLSLIFLLTGIFTGAVLTPVLLPYVPFKGFAAKGVVTGLILSVYAIWASILCSASAVASAGFYGMLALFLFSTAVTSFLSMNFTGATPFTSPSGVEKEMKQFIPVQVVTVLISAGLWICSAF